MLFPDSGDLEAEVRAAEVVGPEVEIVDAVLEHVVDGGQDGGGDGYDRTLEVRGSIPLGSTGK